MKAFAAAATMMTMSAMAARADAIVVRLDDLHGTGPRILGLQPPLATDAGSAAGRARIAAAFLGKGSNFWGPNRTLMTQCVAFDPGAIVNAPTAPGTASADNWNNFNQVNSLTDHFRSESFGASANITYKIFSLGGSGTSSSNNHFNSTSRYIDIDKGVVTDSFILAELPGAQRLRIMPGIPGSEFTRICGQSYVWKVSFGSTVSGTIDFETQLSEKTGENAARITAGITGILSGGANTSKKLDRSRPNRLNLLQHQGRTSQIGECRRVDFSDQGLRIESCRRTIE